MGRRDAAADRAEKDRREGRGLDKRIAARELALAELIGKDAVFHRAEECRQHAEQEEGHEQQGDGVPEDAGRRERRGPHLGKLHALRDFGFIEAVGELAAERRQKEGRQYEQGSRERRGGASFLFAELEEHDKRQRVLEEVVAERGEELAPKHGRETPRPHQRGDHGKHLLPWHFLLCAIFILPCRERNEGI